MKPILALLVLMITVPPHIEAQDIRSKVAPISESDTDMIDPDRSIYGVEWGSSEDEFISKFGQPNGFMRLKGSQTVMLYGKNHAFIFTASKLSGVRITSTVLDWKLALTLIPRNRLDDVKWELSNGIREGMNLADVKKILGDRLKTDHNQRYFKSDKARIEIDFARYPMEGDKDEAYKMYGLYIRREGAGAIKIQPVPPKPLPVSLPEATQSSTAEVAEWWQGVRAAATELVKAIREKNHALLIWFRAQPPPRRWPVDESVVPQKLKDDIATAREKYGRLLAEGQVKSYRVPVEDMAPVTLYRAYPRYTDKARVNKTAGVVRMQVEFRSDGTIGDVKVLAGLGDGLDEEAVKAARETIFLPAVKDGTFVTMLRVLHADFNMG